LLGDELDILLTLFKKRDRI